MHLGLYGLIAMNANQKVFRNSIWKAFHVQIPPHVLLLGSQANSIVPFILTCKERNPLSTITGVLCHPKRSSFQNDNRIRSRWKQTERGAKDASSITKSKPWWELVWSCRVRRWIHGLQVLTRPESWHSLEAKQSCKCWKLRCAYQNPSGWNHWKYDANRPRNGPHP